MAEFHVERTCWPLNFVRSPNLFQRFREHAARTTLSFGHGCARHKRLREFRPIQLRVMATLSDLVPQPGKIIAKKLCWSGGPSAIPRNVRKLGCDDFMRLLENNTHHRGMISCGSTSPASERNCRIIPSKVASDKSIDSSCESPCFSNPITSPRPDTIPTCKNTLAKAGK